MSNLAFVNIASWTPEQVANWLKGLDDAIVAYAGQFVEARVSGRRLLYLGYHDLQRLHIHKLGHQELILEAKELLSSLHHVLETETLQSISLQLGCKARSLHNEVKAIRLDPSGHNAGHRLPVSVLSGITDTVTSIKNLVFWLDRSPFEGGAEYIRIKNKILALGSEMLTAAQDNDVIASEDVIMNSCLKLSDTTDKLVTESKDPIILQPASIELATIRKKPEEELGMHIQSSHNGTHTIGRIKDESPADRCGKVEEGDEVIQVNYQTVVGWQLKKLVAALKADEKEVTLTLKKRPHHVNPFGVSPKKRKVPKNLKQSTFPKVASRRKSKEDKKTGSRLLQDCFVNSVPPQVETFSESAQELENEGDTDNEIDNDVFQAGATLPVIQIEAKQRRATVSGGSPTITRPAITIDDVTPLPRPKSHTIGSPSSDGSAASVTSPELTLSPHLLSPEPRKDSSQPEPASVSETPVTAGSLALSPETQRRVELRIHTSSSTSSTTFSTPAVSSKRKGSEAAAKEIAGSEDTNSPTLIRLVRIDSTRRAELAEELSDGNEDGVDGEERRRRSEAGPVASATMMSPLSTVEEDGAASVSNTSNSSSPGSYTVNIVGGVPQTTTTAKDSRDNSPNQSPTVQLRKKTFMRRIGANRRISCKDLGRGDCQGWLYKKTEAGHGLRNKWVKRWFVLKDKNLYYYKGQQDLKAKGVVHLPGFQVSPAPEIKSKKHAFKAHNPGMTFYFASDRQDDMGKWMNKMGLAAIVYDTHNLPTTAGFSRPDSPACVVSHENHGYYSESDDDNESPTPRRKPAPGAALMQAVKDDGSLSNLYQTIQEADLGIDGSDIRNKRKSAITNSKKLQIRHSAELEAGRRLSSLQRTLKDKEQELAMLDTLLQNTRLDSETIQTFKCQHADLFGKPTARHSHSDPDSSC